MKSSEKYDRVQWNPWSSNASSNNSNYLIRFGEALNELIYDTHLKQGWAHERTMCLLFNIALEQWLNSLHSCSTSLLIMKYYFEISRD